MSVSCPICSNKFKNGIKYLHHLEKYHVEDIGCGCSQKGGFSNFEKKIEKARNIIKKTQTNIESNKKIYDLKFNNKNLNNDEIMQLIMIQNEYFKKIIKYQEYQISKIKNHIENICSLISK